MVDEMTHEDPWLSDDQQHAWRHWIAISTALPAALNRQLQDGSGLSLSDYDVLVALSEITRGRLRVGDLATSLGWERSRVSHHVTRMQKRGLVAREECEDDGRGAWVALSGSGRQAMRDQGKSLLRITPTRWGPGGIGLWAARRA